MKSLVERYRRLAVSHGIHTLEGDADAANCDYDRLKETFLDMFKNGEANELFGLYDDPDPWVQSWAASHTLEVDEKVALEKLGMLATAGIPHVSTSAKYTILEWKAGALRFVHRLP